MATRSLGQAGDDGFADLELNDRIHAQWQGNRNPFIGHPDWAESIR